MKALVFDFGGVLVDWNPHHLYDSYFGSKEKATWFLENICTNEWNSQMDYFSLVLGVKIKYL